MTAPRHRPGEPRRAWLAPDGPLLVEGPVVLLDRSGAPVVCDRFLVAVCTCRRSRRYPLCDTSHRRRVREPEAGTEPVG